MNIRAAIAAACAAALVGTAMALLLPASASARSAPRTLTLTAVTVKTALLGRKAMGASEDDLNRHGDLIGFDELRVTFTATEEVAGVTFDLGGGFMYGTVKLSGSSADHGRVTGGTGAFKGATGTIKARVLNKSGTRTRITITYRT